MEKVDLKKTAIDSFNAVWGLIDKKDRSSSDDLEMISLAHKSLHYWIQAGGTILNIVRGEWMISHVYSVLGIGEAALYHAKTCFEETLDNEIKDFDAVFAFEAMAFAYKVLNNIELKDQYLKEAYELVDHVEKKEDKDYCLSQLDLLK
mgnify:CR=1 FL=1